jgi:hypothetical protein
MTVRGRLAGLHGYTACGLCGGQQSQSTKSRYADANDALNSHAEVSALVEERSPTDMGADKHVHSLRGKPCAPSRKESCAVMHPSRRWVGAPESACLCASNALAQCGALCARVKPSGPNRRYCFAGNGSVRATAIRNGGSALDVSRACERIMGRNRRRSVGENRVHSACIRRVRNATEIVRFGRSRTDGGLRSARLPTNVLSRRALCAASTHPSARTSTGCSPRCRACSPLSPVCVQLRRRSRAVALQGRSRSCLPRHTVPCVDQLVDSR